MIDGYINSSNNYTLIRSIKLFVVADILIIAYSIEQKISGPRNKKTAGYPGFVKGVMLCLKIQMTGSPISTWRFIKKIRTKC